MELDFLKSDISLIVDVFIIVITSSHKTWNNRSSLDFSFLESAVTSYLEQDEGGVTQSA